jgi:uncharacterized membrane protein HdeD (DUF308 family)
MSSPPEQEFRRRSGAALKNQRRDKIMFLLTQNWWALVIRGIFALIFGILAFVLPGITLRALVLLFGAYAIVDGLFAIVASMDAKGTEKKWWALLIEGILGIAVGVMTFMWPGVTALTLLYLIGFWAIATGVFEIAEAIKLRKIIKHEWLLALAGVASIVFGAFLFAFPGAGALAVVWWIGAYAIFFGVMMISLGLRLRGRERAFEERHEQPRAA